MVQTRFLVPILLAAGRLGCMSLGALLPAPAAGLAAVALTGGGWLLGRRLVPEAALENVHQAQQAGGVGTYEWAIRRGIRHCSAGSAALYGLVTAPGGRAGPVPFAAWMDRILPEDRPAVSAALDRAIAECGPYSLEFRVRLSDGGIRWLGDRGRVLAGADGRAARGVGTIRDITEERGATAELATREATLWAMLEANPIGVLRGDIHGRIHDANDALLRIIGRNQAELAAGLLRWDSLTPPEWLPADAATIAEVQATGRCSPYEKEYWRTDGSRVPILVGFTIVGERKDETIAFVLDLTERKQAEAALLRAKTDLEQRVAERTAELRRIYDRTPAAFHSCDAAGRIVEVSAEWLAFLGYARDEALGRRIPDFLTPESGIRWEAAAVTLRQGGDEMREVEYRMRRRDGEVVDVLLRARAERDAAGVFLRSYAVILDITARNQAEARLREAQKLEALGRIAGGIAHDFNNILQVVAGALRLMQNQPKDADRVRRYTRAALEAAERGAGVTRRMLSFARRDQLQSGPVAPAAVLEGLATLLHGALGPDIRLEVEAPAGLPPLQADRMQLDLVLFNLALNARDAMPRGGLLRLEAATEQAEADGAQGLTPGRYLRLSLRDTGIGMDAATLARATEPFFTTKEVGKGTGLGLAMAHGFAAQSGGALAIESAQGQGTRVTLWLPEASAEAAAPAPPAAPARHGLRLLMVEDEAPLRGVMATALREEGLAVTEAASGAAALALLESGSRFDLVLTDHAMPSMTGGMLAAELGRRWPGLPVVILTGNAETAALDMAPGTPVLRKPLGPAELAAQLWHFAAAPATA
ncbi:PAS domain S-box protein [Belnapia sp. T18]|uniref:histidine kinase n=1 Tax=Belnapia arida TaxID=2804533 RepID=A0ABS1TYX6_9PROT|nr:PAS domain S-box protein [Belnapia arida]MBL6076929.1 PAS domain S-box protein [Belnapia arida]